MDKKEYTGQPPIGIWYIEDNMACRIHPETREKITLPLEEETLGQIKKQELASELFESFQKVPNDDINLIGYLDVILNEAFGYLDLSNKNQLLLRMEEIKNTNFVNEENKVFLNYFISFIKEGRIDAFLEVLEEFKKVNAPYLVAPLIENQTSEYHR